MLILGKFNYISFHLCRQNEFYFVIIEIFSLLATSISPKNPIKHEHFLSLHVHDYQSLYQNRGELGAISITRQEKSLLILIKIPTPPPPPPLHPTQKIISGLFKDGAYFCYCAYVLCTSRYSRFLRMLPTNTGIFLHGLKLYGESRT